MAHEPVKVYFMLMLENPHSLGLQNWSLIIIWCLVTNRTFLFAGIACQQANLACKMYENIWIIWTSILILDVFILIIQLLFSLGFIRYGLYLVTLMEISRVLVSSITLEHNRGWVEDDELVWIWGSMFGILRTRLT